MLVEHSFRALNYAVDVVVVCCLLLPSLALYLAGEAHVDVILESSST